MDGLGCQDNIIGGLISLLHQILLNVQDGKLDVAEFRHEHLCRGEETSRDVSEHVVGVVLDAIRTNKRLHHHARCTACPGPNLQNV